MLLGQQATQEDGAEATPADGSELESDCPSASDETQVYGGTEERDEECKRNSCWQPKEGNIYFHSSNTHRKPKT